MAKRRKFTPEFKAELVFKVLSGGSSQAEVCRRHNLNENQLSQFTQMLQRQGYTLGTRRVARLMRENHLLVAVKRASY